DGGPELGIGLREIAPGGKHGASKRLNIKILTCGGAAVAGLTYRPEYLQELAQLLRMHRLEQDWILRAFQLLARALPDLAGDDGGGQRAVFLPQRLDHRRPGRASGEGVITQHGLRPHIALAKQGPCLGEGRRDHRLAAPFAEQQAHGGMHLDIVVDVHDRESLQVDAGALARVASGSARVAAHEPPRYDQPERGAGADPGLGFYRVLEEAGQALDDRQSEAEASVAMPASSCLEEFLENRLAILGPYARAGVGDPRDDRVASSFASELDAALFRVLD